MIARRIAFHLRLHRSTVRRVLTRYRMPIFRNISTGLPVRKPQPKRYEVAQPGTRERRVVSLTAVDGACMVRGPQPRPPAWSEPAPSVPERRALAATATFTTPSTTTRGSRTRNRRRRTQGHRRRFLDPCERVLRGHRRDRDRRDDRQRRLLSLPRIRGNRRTQAQVDQALPAADQRQSRAFQPPPSPPNGPTQSPTPAKQNTRPTRPGCITTTTTDPTPASAAKPPQPAFTTSRGSTPSVITATIRMSSSTV